MTGTRISYGKLRVPFQRMGAAPLCGIVAVPESSFTGRQNVVFSCEVDVEVLGDNFMPAYTEGDNSSVVATDTMKNFVLSQALAYEGATLEGFLAFLGRGFLSTYEPMRALRLTARELPFEPVEVPDPNGSFRASDRLVRRGRGDRTEASLDFGRDGAGAPLLNGHWCARSGLELLKTTGSAFTRFARDEYTTLPERVDRPLYVRLDVRWRYADPGAAVGSDPASYVAPQQVRDVIGAVFHDFVSESIQHLVHAMAERLLLRFGQLAEVAFAAENRTHDPVGEWDPEGPDRVYSEPFPAQGLITLVLAREGEAATLDPQVRVWPGA